MARRVASASWAGRLSQLLPFVVFLAGWQILSGLVPDPTFLPSPFTVAPALYDLATSSSLARDLTITLVRALGGLALGALIGIPLGAAMALTKPVDTFFGPLVKATYSLPKTALVPLLILWFGVGSITNIIAVSISTLLPIIVYTYHGIHGVPKVLIWSGRAMGTSERQMMYRVLLPGAMHAILTGIRIALGFSFVIAISAEMIASTAGIGKLMFIYGENGVYNYMFAAVLAMMIAAYLADRALVAFSNYLLRWDKSSIRTVSS
jgi:NitT/TauT family transport system permease protein